ncbi:MAG: hypothetical protein RRZ24_10230 [Clostridia bacterium]
MQQVNGVGTVNGSRDIGSDIDSNIEDHGNESLKTTVGSRGVL